MAIADLDLGPAQILWGATDLGLTFGGVTANIKKSSAELKADQFGDTVLNRIKKGLAAQTVEVPMAEYTAAKLALITGGTVVAGGVKVTANDVGGDMLAGSLAMTIKPIVDGTPSATPDDWLQFPKTYPELDAQIVYNPDSQRILKVTFHVFPDESDSYSVMEKGETA